MSSWQEVSVSVHQESAEAVSELLQNEGAQGVAFEGDSLIREAKANRWGDYYPAESGNGEQITVKAYFYQHKSAAELEKLTQMIADLTQYGLKVGEVELKSKEIFEADWANAWKQHYHPTRIGKVVVEPSWEPAPNLELGEILITLDPGMAFGTGTHPSTAMCIAALQEIAVDQSVVFDVGTGSGLLAIVAAKLGAQVVEAVDIDPVAVDVCRENASINAVKINCYQGSLEDIAGKANIIICNIIADVIIELLPLVAEKLEPQGVFLASGIIDSRGEMVKATAIKHGFKVDSLRSEGEWLAYTFRRED